MFLILCKIAIAEREANTFLPPYEGGFKKTIRFSIAVILVAFALLFTAPTVSHAQTVVAAVSGSSYTLGVSKSTLSTAFVQELNDGSTMDSSTIYLTKYGSDWYLAGVSVKSGKNFSTWTKLDVSGSNAYIFQGSLGKTSRCGHPSCNFDPCTLAPVCAGECNNNGVNCVLKEDDLQAAGYLGSFH